MRCGWFFDKLLLRIVDGWMHKRLTLGRVEIQGCSKSYGAHLKDAIEEDELGRRASQRALFHNTTLGWCMRNVSFPPQTRTWPFFQRKKFSFKMWFFLIIKKKIPSLFWPENWFPSFSNDETSEVKWWENFTRTNLSNTREREREKGKNRIFRL